MSGSGIARAVVLLWASSCMAVSCQPGTQTSVPPDLDEVFRSSSVTFVEYEEERALGEGESFRQPGSSVRITVLKISRGKTACLFQVEDDEDRTQRSGWVMVGTCAQFAPEQVGTMGLELVALKEGKAIISLRWGGVTTGPGD
jgi:hypothetical protein